MGCSGNPRSTCDSLWVFVVPNENGCGHQTTFALFNVGPSQVPTVIAAELDGANYDGANFKKIVYVINVDKIAQSVSDPRFVNTRFELHSVQSGGMAADLLVASSSGFDPTMGAFSVPARSVSVFVSR